MLDNYQPWWLSHRADPEARVLADRHYNRQKVGTKHFVPPGRCCVFLTENKKAFWVTSFPFAEYVNHAWAGAWICSAFRSEDAGKASDLILKAVAATRAFFGEPPSLGMVTFIDTTKVKPMKRRGKIVWGYSYWKAGFRYVGDTQGDLLAFQLLPDKMPKALPARGGLVDLLN